MAFDLQIWKKKIKGQLKGWRSWMQKAGVKSIYAVVSSSVLWPVVEAARQGEWGALTALGGALAGMGGSLLTNRIEKWQDKISSAQELEKEITGDEELRAELDEVMQKLDAFSMAKEQLAKSGHDWFDATLLKELKKLGNFQKFETVFEGSGAVAQGESAVALGEGAQFTKDVTVKGDLLGPGSTKIVTGHDLQPSSGGQCRSLYLRRLRAHCEALPLAALGGEEGSEEELKLDHIYIDLDTTEEKEIKTAEKDLKKDFAGSLRKKKPVTALEAVTRSKRVVLLGNPGSGKSTFARKLLAWLAAANLGEAIAPPGFSADLLPVMVVLRDFAQRLSGLDLSGLSEEKLRERLALAMKDQLLADLERFGATGFADEMEKALTDGKCVMILDGFDEVPFNSRNFVRKAVAATCSLYNLEKVIVTCRIRSYVGKAVMAGFDRSTLAPFDEAKIRKFGTAWYETKREFGQVDAKQAKEKAKSFIDAALADELREISENPMMLTTMAIIHQKEIGLPKERVRLYNLAVDVLLLRWQKHKIGDSEITVSVELRKFLTDSFRVRMILERLAYEAHSSGKEAEVADISRGDALSLLEKDQYMGKPGLAGEYLDYVDQRAGILLGQGGEEDHPTSYSFPHRIFQEYLAGCHLVSKGIRIEYISHSQKRETIGL